MLDGTTWVGNFIGGPSKYDCVLPHPNRSDVVVVSGGQGYIVSPNFKRVTSTFGGAIANVHEHSSRTLVINHQNLSFEAISASGSLWKSKRISWDGMRNIEVNDSSLTGEAWLCDGTWHSFHLDLATGIVTGGSYYEA
jgi:hypothetical protein